MVAFPYQSQMDLPYRLVAMVSAARTANCGFAAKETDSGFVTGHNFTGSENARPASRFVTGHGFSRAKEGQKARGL